MTYFIWVVCLNFSVCGFAGLIANAAVLLKLYRTRKENTVFNKTLASLSVANIISDACFAVTGTMFAYQFSSKRINFKNFYVLLSLHYANRYATGIALSHIMFIAIQRLVAVLYPFRFRRIFTTKVAWIIILLTWIVGPICTSLYHFVFKVRGDPDLPLSYSIIIIGTIIFFCYALILHLLIKRRRLSKRLTNNNEAQSDTSYNFNIFFNSLGVTLLFILFTFPFAIFVLAGSSHDGLRVLFASFLAFKTITDPGVYFFVAKCNCDEKSQSNSSKPKEDAFVVSQNDLKRI